MSSAGGSELFLWDHPMSSYAVKVRIALREKGIPFKSFVPNALKVGKAEEEFHQANPRIEVPTLEDGDLKIFDSTIILEYIEDKWPEPALMPKSPADRARARMIEDICDTHYEAINWGIGEMGWFQRAEGELRDQLMAEAQRQTDVIQAWLTEKLGSNEYFHGSQFGWADVCVAAVVNRSKYNGTGPRDGAPLDVWLKRIKQRPSVKETFAEAEAVFDTIGAMAPAFKSGERKREYRDHRLEWMIKSGGIDVVLEGLKRNNIRFSWP